MPFKLRFPATMIGHWSARYEYDDAIPTAIGPVAQRRGFLTRAEFLALAKWKTPRTQPRCAENSAKFIEEVSRTAFASNDERLRIEVLTLLTGVHWPTASVILHFCSADKYPILDFRALWSLSSAVPTKGYDFPLWDAYCRATRKLAASGRHSMRVVDRALWQYSKEHQPSGS